MHTIIDKTFDPIVPAEGGRHLDVLGERVTIKARAADGGWTLVELATQPETTAPAHSHPWSETYYMLEGGCGMRVGERRFQASAGMTFHIPAGTIHAFEQPVLPGTRMLVLLSPAGGEQFFVDIDREIAQGQGPIDFVKVIEIAARHGVRPELAPAAH